MFIYSYFNILAETNLRAKVRLNSKNATITFEEAGDQFVHNVL